MYNVSQLVTNYRELVGILPSNLPQIPTLTAPLTVSQSGLYVQEKHELCTLENIYYAAPDFNANNYTQWVSGTYVVGNKVGYSGTIYICTVNVTSATNPATDTTHWSVYPAFQNWCLQKYDQASKNMFAEVVKQKKLSHMAKAQLERQQLYRGGGSLTSRIISQGSFVGFQILPQQAEGLLVIIDEVGIQTTEAQATMDFYLYHSSQENYIGKWTLPITSANTFTWQGLLDTSSPPQRNCIMQYLQYNTAGVYFFGYYQDDLQGQAISKDWDCSSAPCYGCDGVNVAFYNQWSRYTTLQNIEVAAADLDPDKKLFDTNKIIFGNNTNWGLNLSLTVRCDLTNYLIDSKTLFADAFAMQLAKEFLGAIARNPRVNPTNSQIQVQAKAELDVKFPGAWIKTYNDYIKGLNLDLTNFSKSCMPCDEKKKMGFSAI